MTAERAGSVGVSRLSSLPRLDVGWVVADALAEDVGPGDVTSDSVLEEADTCGARLLLKETGALCGLGVAEAVFRALDPDMGFEAFADDGEQVDRPPHTVAQVEGLARALLTGERTALNLLGHLSGIATLTRRFVDAVDGTGAVILDTRKTTPGLRRLEKYAVRCGGGTNHRLGLYDAILVKDNHLRLAGGIRPAVERLRAEGVLLPIEVEADTLDHVREAVAAGVDRVLLDNMAPATIAEAVAIVRGRAQLEASGGVSLETVRAIAETGVDFISVGRLTHSARSLDFSMEVL